MKTCQSVKRSSKRGRKKSTEFSHKRSKSDAAFRTLRTSEIQLNFSKSVEFNKNIKLSNDLEKKKLLEVSVEKVCRRLIY